MKFGVFLELAKVSGFNAVATGHYARRLRQADGSWEILEGVDKSKDQSYFLALLQQHQIAAARFPVGELHKTEVRQGGERIQPGHGRKKGQPGNLFHRRNQDARFSADFCPG